MDSFKLTFDIPASTNKIAHGQQILFLGSCFSDEMALKAKYFGLNVASNPVGTIFHPLALSQFILESLLQGNEERIVQRADLFLSWDSGSVIYGLSEQEVKKKLLQIRKKWLEKLKQADFMFVTFGTAWGYKLNQSGELVANCHKFPSTFFNKELTLQNEILDSWRMTLRLLKEISPNLQIIFTVSPVRHVKDGLVENNRSKAILMDSVRQLEREDNCSYFPSYEIVLDELRDYRFFKIDRVHPNQEAIDYVWKRFSEVYFSSETNTLTKEIEKLRLAEAHISLFPNSEESKLHIVNTAEKRLKLLSTFPMICWG